MQRDTSTTGTHFPHLQPCLVPKGRSAKKVFYCYVELSVGLRRSNAVTPPVLCHEVGQGSSLDSARLDFPRTPRLKVS